MVGLGAGRPAAQTRTQVWRDLETEMSKVHNFTATTPEGREKPFPISRDRFLLVVNTASKCGFTPQYEELEALYRKYYAQGFVVLGFPCNQFAAQESGDGAEIERFCSRPYSMRFPCSARSMSMAPELIRFTAFSSAKTREL
jgi:glutathione peroxidase-family protein